MDDLKKKSPSNNLIVLYQGDCTFCRYCVDLVLRNSDPETFVFYPLNSDEGKAIALSHELKIDSASPDTIAVLESGSIPLYKWKAGVRIAQETSFPFKLVYFAAVLVPAFIGDRIYDWIGRHRNLLCKIVRCNEKNTC